MPKIKRELDPELCKAIMLWTENWLDRDSTTPFEFEGYTPQNVLYNTRRLFNVNLILVRVPRKVDRNMVRYWPIGITPSGRKFLETAKDEKRWSEAVEAFREHNKINRSETLKPLLEALFAGAREDA